MVSFRRTAIALATLCWYGAGRVWAQSSTGDSVLVVLENALKKESFSTFWAQLEGVSDSSGSDGNG